MVRHPCGRLHALLAVLIFCGTAAAVSAQPTTAPSENDIPSGAATHWIIGRQLLEEGDVKGALQHLHFAYRQEPQEPLVALAFQEALAAAGLVEDAVGVLDRLIAAHPDSTDWYLRRSMLNLRAGRPRRALDDLRTVRALGGTTIEVLATEARVLTELGRVEQALDVYRDGLEAFPEEGPRLYLGMADVLQEAGQAARIPGVMDEGIARYADDPGLHLVKIRALAAVGRDEEALAAARAADAGLSPQVPEDGTRYDPETGDVLMTPAAPWSTDLPEDGFQVELADFYARHGEVGRAVAVLEPLATTGELGEVPSLWLARLLLGTGRQEEAAALVAEINDRWPESGRGWFLRGKLDEAAGDWPAALSRYRRAADTAPGDPEIHVSLVRAMLVNWERDVNAAVPDSAGRAKRQELKRTALATSSLVSEGDTEGQMVLGYAFRVLGDLEWAAWRYGLAAADPELRKTALIQQSICHDESGEPDRARRALETLQQEYPEDPEVANSLGYFLAEKGEDLAKAEALVRLALDAEPANGAYLDSLGWVCYRLGRHDEALDFLIRAVNVLPEDPIILEHLGMVLSALGQHPEAGNAFRRAIEAGGDRERLEAALAAADSAAAVREP